jgi:hypothetical protein
VGIFHAYTRGFNQDRRQHKLFIITSGGCNKLSDEYFNMFLDIDGGMSAGDICSSTETWYARKTNERNNCRILHEIASEFGLNIPTMSDPYSYDYTTIAASTTETIHSDLFLQKNGSVTVLNKCTDTTTSNNGILYNMHPSEGVWLFKGPLKTNSGMTYYGDSFGDERLQTSFPIAASIIKQGYSWKNNLHNQRVCSRPVGVVTTRDSNSIARIDTVGNIYTNTDDVERYTCVDESFLSSLQLSHWKRENGITELIPIAVIRK